MRPHYQGTDVRVKDEDSRMVGDLGGSRGTPGRAVRRCYEEMHGRHAFWGTLALCGVLAAWTPSTTVATSASGPSDPEPITLHAGTVAPSTSSAIQVRIPIARGGTYQYVDTPLIRSIPAGQVGAYIQGIIRCLKSGRVCDLS